MFLCVFLYRPCTSRRGQKKQHPKKEEGKQHHPTRNNVHPRTCCTSAHGSARIAARHTHATPDRQIVGSLGLLPTFPPQPHCDFCRALPWNTFRWSGPHVPGSKLLRSHALFFLGTSCFQTSSPNQMKSQEKQIGMMLREEVHRVEREQWGPKRPRPEEGRKSGSSLLCNWVEINQRKNPKVKSKKYQKNQKENSKDNFFQEKT